MVLIALVLIVVGGLPVAAQHQRAIPEYQVIFDDFSYDAPGYPDTTTGIKTLFGENDWIGRKGEVAYTGHAWYYYNWRWQKEGKTIHPSAHFEMHTEAPHSLSLVAGEGYTRTFSRHNEVPITLVSGFTHEQGTWVLSARFADLETISYFTQAFWLTSPMFTSAERSGVKTWSEFNFEWQNWFAIRSQRGKRGWNTDLRDDTWARKNKWVKRVGYKGKIFPEGQMPSPQRRTYMANGLRMYERAVATLNTGETVGGVPLRNTRISDAGHFSCHTSVQGRIIDVNDPVACMDFVLRDLDDRPNPWVHLMVQYDSHVVRYRMMIPARNGDYVYMESSATLNLRSLPLMVHIGSHTPNDVIVLGPDETARLDVDWFYYSPATDLDVWSVLEDVAAFRERGWGQVNLDAEPLEAPPTGRWAIRTVRPPTSFDPGWIVDTTLRGSNGIQVQWKYRTRSHPTALFSEWSGWQDGGFRFVLDTPAYEVELDVRAKDHHATDHGERPTWAEAPCTRFNYVTAKASLCEGSLVEESF